MASSPGCDATAKPVRKMWMPNPLARPRQLRGNPDHDEPVLIEPRLNLRALTVMVRGKVVLDSVTLSASDEVLGIAGPNGGGKSTLMRAIESASRKDRAGVSLRPMAGRQRPTIGYLPQRFDLPKELTVRQFVEYSAWVKGVGKDDASSALRLARLDEFSEQRLRHVSGGVAQRAGFASVLVNAPDVLLLDEPTTGVDIHQREVMRGLIAEQSRGRVTLFSSHIAEDLEQLCDRVLVLSRGEVRFLGTIAEALATTGESTFSVALLVLSEDKG